MQRSLSGKTIYHWSIHVRQLIREEPFVTGADVLIDAAGRMGDLGLRISRK